MKIDRLKELVLILILMILTIFLVRYLNLIKYICLILTIFIPVFIGFIYAWIFNPLINNLSHNCNRNFICIVLFLIFIFIFGLFFYFFIPTLYKELMEFIKLVPDLFGDVNDKIDNMGLKTYLDNIIDLFVKKVPLYFISLISNIFKYVGVVLIGLILGLYMSMDYERIVKCIYDVVPKKLKCIVINLTQDVSSTVRKCVNGTFLVAFCVFFMNTLCFFFIGIDAPILIGVLCGLTDLIPYVGPYIGGIVAVLVGFTESKLLGILTLISCIVVQSIENYILQPLIMSKSIKISPILIIIGLLVFGKLFGVFGMILATPFLAMLKVIFMHLNEILRKCSEQ